MVGRGFWSVFSLTSGELVQSNKLLRNSQQYWRAVWQTALPTPAAQTADIYANLLWKPEAHVTGFDARRLKAPPTINLQTLLADGQLLYNQIGLLSHGQDSGCQLNWIQGCTFAPQDSGVAMGGHSGGTSPKNLRNNIMQDVSNTGSECSNSHLEWLLFDGK